MVVYTAALMAVRIATELTATSATAGLDMETSPRADNPGVLESMVIIDG